MKLSILLASTLLLVTLAGILSAGAEDRDAPTDAVLPSTPAKDAPADTLNAPSVLRKPFKDETHLMCFELPGR